MRNSPRKNSKFTTDPLTREIEYAANAMPRLPMESDLDWQFRKEARVMDLHFEFQKILDLTLDNDKDRQAALNVLRNSLIFMPL